MKIFSLTLLSCLFLPLVSPTQSVGYRFDRPELVTLLPDDLREISGLGMSSDGKSLVAVQDEDGLIYRLDPQTGEVLARIPFWKDGDYEGIEYVNDDVWVVKSSGTLYQITDLGKTSQETIKHGSFLDEDNDVEGLAYDRLHQRLLVICKADGGPGYKKDLERCIFAFDLRTKTWDEKAVYLVHRDQIQRYLKTCPPSQGYDKLCSFFNEQDDYELSPSAVAIHPLTGDVYTTSSVGKLLVIMKPDGSIRHIERLDKEFFPQPEGLAFAPDGTLYISSEGKKDGRGCLLRLPYQPSMK